MYLYINLGGKNLNGLVPYTKIFDVLYKYFLVKKSVFSYLKGYIFLSFG